MEKKMAMKEEILSYVGDDELQNAYDHGASIGISGFIYYHETCAFFRRHKKEIVKKLIDQAHDIGYGSAIESVMDFNCLKKMDITEDEIGLVLYGTFTDKEDEEEHDGILTLIENALAWYALEETAREVIESSED